MNLSEAEQQRICQNQRLLQNLNCGRHYDCEKRQLLSEIMGRSARIKLHRDYSLNKEGWFHWLFRQLDLKPGMKILELGAGNGTLWSQNLDRVPKGLNIVLSDISEGILADAKNEIGDSSEFQYAVFDAQKIPFTDNTFDLVIANHMLFYCDNIPKTLKEVKRVMKKGASFA